MALERFIPKSPDPFIRNSQDFEVAKFGHLNTIIEYINSYVVTDSLQLAGSGPITSTARYITDSLGNASAISISTTRVGIGTTTPSAELHIDGHNGFGYSLRITTNKVGGVAYAGLISDYVTGVEQYQYGGPGWGWPNWTTTRAGGTAAAPTAVPSNYGLNEYSFWGHDGTGGGQAYSMMTRTSETWTTTGHGIYTTFNTVATGSTALVERMRFTGSGNITFNNASDTAKVAIKGTGSTSATTSFLVQNSAGTTAFSIKDNGVTNATYIEGGTCWFNNVNANNYMKAITGISIGFNTDPSATAHIVGANSSTSSYAVKVLNSVGQGIFSVANDGYTQIGDFTNQGYGSFFAFLRPSGATRATIFNQGNQNLSIQNVNGNVTFQNTPITIIGTGSTSATTSLLVQNSGGTNTFAVSDSGDTTANGSFYLTAPSLSGYFQISFLGNYQQQIRGAYGETIQFGVGGNTIKFNATEVYWSYNLYGSAASILSNGVGCFGSQYASSASAQLEVISTTKGFLPPRMTTAQKNAITTPAAGLVVFDTTLNKLCVYTTAWQTITSV